MHIAKDYDQVHTQILLELQQQWQKPIPEVLDLALEIARLHSQPKVNPALALMQEAGLIGCLKGGGNLSVDYKDHLWGDQ
ncbi:MAG: hypothetical protein RL095_2991 [Verrucomicrobiota bacterium]|jgi:hypothetical protein